MHMHTYMTLKLSPSIYMSAHFSAANHYYGTILYNDALSLFLCFLYLGGKGRLLRSLPSLSFRLHNFLKLLITLAISGGVQSLVPAFAFISREILFILVSLFIHYSHFKFLKTHHHQPP